jgi:hypothetical protein
MAHFRNEVPIIEQWHLSETTINVLVTRIEHFLLPFRLRSTNSVSFALVFFLVNFLVVKMFFVVFIAPPNIHNLWYRFVGESRDDIGAQRVLLVLNVLRTHAVWRRTHQRRHVETECAESQVTSNYIECCSEKVVSADVRRC